MLPPPVNLPIRFLAHSATLPLRAGVSGVVWAGRAVTWFHDKYSAHQAHKARLGFTRELLVKCPNVLGDFSTNFGPSNQGADRHQEVNKTLEDIKKLIQNQEKKGSKFKKAIKDYEGFRKILLNGEHFRGNNQGMLFKVKKDGDTHRHGLRGDECEVVGDLANDVHSKLDETYECEEYETNKLYLCIPTEKPSKGEPVKVLIQAHGCTDYKQFTVKENGLKLKFFTGSGETQNFKRLTPLYELGVHEVQRVPSGTKTLDYTLSAFTGAGSALFEYQGKYYKEKDIPEHLIRKVRPIITQEKDELLQYAKSTNTIVVSPKLVDNNDKEVITSLSEIYTILQEKYPNNPLEISCKFCRSIPD